MLGESKVTWGLSIPQGSGSLSAELLKGQVCSLISPWVLGCIQGWMSSGGRAHKLENQMSVAVDLSNFCLKHCCQEQPSAFKCLEKKEEEEEEDYRTHENTWRSPVSVYTWSLAGALLSSGMCALSAAACGEKTQQTLGSPWNLQYFPSGPLKKKFGGKTRLIGHIHTVSNNLWTPFIADLFSFTYSF